MIKRLRDIKRYVKPQGKITFEEWEAVEKQALDAKTFIDPANPISTLLREELKNAEEIILNNRIHEVREIKSVSDVFQKIFIIRKQEQIDELVGQIKFIRELFVKMQLWVNNKDELEKMEVEGKIAIERSKEKRK